MFDHFEIHNYPEGYEGPKTPEPRVAPPKARGGWKGPAAVLGMALVAIASLIYGSGVVTPNTEAHNGVQHGGDTYIGNLKAAVECQQAAANLVSSGPGASYSRWIPVGATGWSVEDPTPGIREALTVNACRVNEQIINNAIAEAEEGLSGHWDDKLTKAENERNAVASYLARVLARNSYYISFNVNPAAPVKHGAVVGSFLDQQWRASGYVTQAALDQIGVIPVD